jgi:uncharacterized membrane protein
MENITKKTKILAAISYIPFPPLFLIPLFISKNDGFDEFHGKQGLVLFLAWFVVWVVSLIPLIAIIAYLGFLALIISAVIAAVQAFLGNRWQIPLLGRYAVKLKF